MTKDIVDNIIILFDYMIEKATIDMKDYEIVKNVYREKLITLFEDEDRID